jgi:hypothetical protein
MATTVIEFKTLAEAEDYLRRHGFKPLPDSCDWRNDAGCYPIEREPYGMIQSFRVEIIRLA